MPDETPGIEIARRLDATLNESIDAARIVFEPVGPTNISGAPQQTEPMIRLGVAQWSKLVSDAARLIGYMRGSGDA